MRFDGILLDTCALSTSVILAMYVWGRGCGIAPQPYHCSILAHDRPIQLPGPAASPSKAFVCIVCLLPHRFEKEINYELTPRFIQIGNS